MFWQIISAVIFYLMLGFGLFLLWRYQQNSKINQIAWQTLLDVHLKNAESIQKVADAVYILAKKLETS